VKTDAKERPFSEKGGGGHGAQRKKGGTKREDLGQKKKGSHGEPAKLLSKEGSPGEDYTKEGTPRELK